MKNQNVKFSKTFYEDVLQEVFSERLLNNNDLSNDTSDLNRVKSIRDKNKKFVDIS